jgi:hypothetical protein
MIYSFQTQKLSQVENRKLKASCIGFGVINAICFSGLIAIACIPDDYETFGEIVFLGVTEAVCAIPMYMLVVGLIRTIKDFKEKNKRVLVGTITKIDRNVSSYGLNSRIWVDKIPFSDPMFPPVGGMLSLYVGQKVEISWLTVSLRVLSIRAI